MPDDVKAGTEPSTAPSNDQTLPEMTSVERSEWQSTGKLPEAPKTEDPAASQDPKDPSATATDAKGEPVKSAPDPDTGKVQEPKQRRKISAEERIAELTRQNKELEERLTKQPVPAKDAKTAEPSPAKPEEKKTDAPKLQPPAFPDLDTFDGTYDDFKQAVKDYPAKLAEFMDARDKAAKEDLEQATKKAESEKQEKELVGQFKSRVDESIKKHPDFVEKAFNQPLPITQGSVLDAWILKRPLGPEILYYMAENPAEIERFNALDPLDAAVELRDLESKLSPSEPAAPARKTTSAPKPPLEVGGKGTSPDDPVEEAVKRGNFRTFLEEQNRRDMRSQKA